jgi:hypothetical protein
MQAVSSEFERIAPRLHRAHQDELDYQRRKRDAQQRGLLSMEFAAEEMIRSTRLLFRHAAETWRRWHAQRST